VANKRKPSPHQKQMRFFTVLFGAIMIGLLIGLLLLLNRGHSFSR
jgi:predicted lipid-binding transport protein (Tim44 family)